MLCQQKLAERLRGAVGYEHLIVSSFTYCNVFTDMTVDAKKTRWFHHANEFRCKLSVLWSLHSCVKIFHCEKCYFPSMAVLPLYSQQTYLNWKWLKILFNAALNSRCSFAHANRSNSNEKQKRKSWDLPSTVLCKPLKIEKLFWSRVNNAAFFFPLMPLSLSFWLIQQDAGNYSHLRGQQERRDAMQSVRAWQERQPNAIWRSFFLF